MLIRDSSGHPRRSNPVLADAHNLELPDFVLVSHRETLASIAVPVLLGQRTH